VATVAPISAGDTIDIGIVGIDGCTPPVGSGPDLVPTNVSGPTEVNWNELITMTATVQNSGSAASGAFQVGFYLTENAPITPEALLLGTCDISALAVSVSDSCNASFVSPVVQTFDVWAFVDNSTAVAEENETNNTRIADTGQIMVNPDPLNPVNNPSFETGNFVGWTIQDLSIPFSALQVGGSGFSPGFGLFSSAPTDGSFAALHGFDGGGPGTIQIGQELTLPLTIETVNFNYRAGWDMVNYVSTSTLPRYFLFRLESPQGSPVMTETVLTAPAGTVNLDTGNKSASVNVTAFAGQSVYLNFVWSIPQHYTGPAFFQIDNVTFDQVTTGPTAVFLDTNGGIQFTYFGGEGLVDSGGVFAGDPGAAQSSAGDTFVVARDTFNGLWVNVFDVGTQAWNGWSFAGGTVQGVPAMAVDGNTGYFGARDAFNSYWLNSFTPGGSFDGWVPLGGVFVTDPVMAAAPNGTIYLVGKDNFDGLWMGRYTSGGGFLGWTFIGGVVQGIPSVTAGDDDAAYIGVRDMFDSVWMARVDSSGITEWSWGAGIVATDPQVAASQGQVFVTALDSGGAPWYQVFTEGVGSNWQGWAAVGGVLTTVSPAATGGSLFLSGVSGAGIWWHNVDEAAWSYVGFPGLAAGPSVASPR